MTIFDQILSASLSADRGAFGVLSTGEKLAAALVLNRPDWLEDMDYTIADAIHRLDHGWVEQIPKVAKAIAEERARSKTAAEAAGRVLQIARLTSAASTGADPTPIDLVGSFITYAYAPGYRDIQLVLAISDQAGHELIRGRINLSKDDSESIAASVREVHESAWRRGSPIDASEGELRPHWLGPPR